MPHFGPRVLGQDRYNAELAAETGGAGGHFGPRVTGRKVPPPPPAPRQADPGESVRATLERIKAGQDLGALVDEELAREDPRPSVVRALMSAGAKRGLSVETLDRLAAATAPK